MQILATPFRQQQRSVLGTIAIHAMRNVCEHILSQHDRCVCVQISMHCVLIVFKVKRVLLKISSFFFTWNYQNATLAISSPSASPHFDIHCVSTSYCSNTLKILLNYHRAQLKVATPHGFVDFVTLFFHLLVILVNGSSRKWKPNSTSEVCVCVRLRWQKTHHNHLLTSPCDRLIQSTYPIFFSWINCAVTSHQLNYLILFLVLLNSCSLCLCAHVCMCVSCVFPFYFAHKRLRALSLCIVSDSIHHRSHFTFSAWMW